VKVEMRVRFNTGEIVEDLIALTMPLTRLFSLKYASPT